MYRGYDGVYVDSGCDYSLVWALGMATEIDLWEKSRSRKTIENGGTQLNFANRFLQVWVWFLVSERTGFQDLYTVPNPPKNGTELPRIVEYGSMTREEWCVEMKINTETYTT